MNIKIKRYRMAAYYPYRIIEAEALVDGKTVYIDLDVDSVGGEDSAVQSWAFSLPLDAEGHDDAYIDIGAAEDDIAAEMALMWRKAPVFADSFDKSINNWAWTNWEHGKD